MVSRAPKAHGMVRGGSIPRSIHIYMGSAQERKVEGHEEARLVDVYCARTLERDLCRFHFYFLRGGQKQMRGGAHTHIVEYT